MAAKLIQRPTYLERALMFRDTDLVKVDTGLRSYLMGYRASDVGRVFENAVYLQLLHDGWSVHVGKLYQKEADFVCLREGERRRNPRSRRCSMEIFATIRHPSLPCTHRCGIGFEMAIAYPRDVYYTATYATPCGGTGFRPARWCLIRRYKSFPPFK